MGPVIMNPDVGWPLLTRQKLEYESKGRNICILFCMFLSEELMTCDCSPALSIREMPIHLPLKA